MAIYQQKVNEEQSFLESFASLEWLDGIISFGFRLLAKLAEPFLAAGLIMSAIDYMSKGTFLVGMPHEAWIVTQGFALESSGGVVLALSFEARAEGDKAKMWMQLVLGLALLIVGGVLFFVEMAAAVKGFNEASMPDVYIYGMAALRSVVSLGYIAVMRTKHHRFSGEASVVPSVQLPSITEAIEDANKIALRRIEQSEAKTSERIQAITETLQAFASQQRELTSWTAEMLQRVDQGLLAITEPLSVLPNLTERLEEVTETTQYQLRSVTEEVSRVKVTLEQRAALPKPKAERTLRSHSPNPSVTSVVSVSASEPFGTEVTEISTEFDKGAFVRQCLTEDPAMTIAAIQRKAAEFGQTIAGSYISETRKAFIGGR
jgi:hypothetical protein